MFITIEGPEGAGKTTVIGKLEEQLKNHISDFIITREPGGIPISEKIREIILNPEHTSMDGKTEALLYAAARRQHLAEKVIPAIKRGTVVICDRFIDSSLAYQGHARGLGIEEVYQINSFAIDGYEPDLTLFLDIDPESGLKRIYQNENRELNRLDMESLSFHHKVYEGYQIVKEKFPNRIVTIDALQEIDKVVEDCLKAILKRL